MPEINPQKANFRNSEGLSVKKRLLLLAGATAATRLLFVLYSPGIDEHYYSGIGRAYLHVAENVFQGRGFVVHVDIAPLESQDSAWSYEPFIDRPLGYAVLILLPLNVVFNPLSIQVLHVALSAIACLLLFQVGRSVFNEKTAFLTAALYAAWPLSARFETIVLPDSVMSFFLLLALWLTLKAMRHKNRSLLFYFLSGCVFGVGMLVRADVMLLPVFLVAGFLIVKPLRSHAGQATMILLGVFVVILPHGIRNYTVTGGKIVPLGLGTGISLWEGISQFGDTLGTVYGDERMARLEGYHSWAYPNGVERDQKRFREAVKIILDHPLWYTGIMFRRLLVLLRPDGIIVRRFMPTPNTYFHENPRASLLEYALSYPVPVLCQLILILLQFLSFVLAAVALVGDKGAVLRWIPAVVILYYIIIHIPTNAESRYFYPAIPFVLILATRGWKLVRRQQHVMV